jgi:hypothetical protein
MFISDFSALLLALIISAIAASLWTYPYIREYFIRHEYPVYICTIGFFLLLNLVVQFQSPTGGDIREHAHAGYLIRRGLVPYTDFFEHHHPLYWYLIAPVFLLSEGISAIYILYVLTLVALAFTCFYLFRIGLRLFHDKRISYLMVIYFLSIKNVLLSFQVSPDPFATLFLLISFYVLIEADGITDYLQSGLLGGISVLFLQKTLLYVLGFAALILVDTSRGRRISINLKRSMGFLLGSIVPVALYLVYMAFVRGQQGLATYYYLNVLFNAEVIVDYDLRRRFVAWGIANWGHFVLAGLGLYLFAKERGRYPKALLILGAQLINIAVGFCFVYRGIIGPQYFQYLAPFFSMAGAVAFVWISTTIPYRLERFYYTACVVVLLVVPISLTALVAASAESDNHEIAFYLRHFEGKRTNCNFIFHAREQYKFFYGGSNADELLERYGIANRKRDLEELMGEGYAVICTGPGDTWSEHELRKGGYREYRAKGARSTRIFYKGGDGAGVPSDE